MSKLPYMTKDEIERRKMTWGSRKRDGQAYTLYFNADNSLYTHSEVENESGYSRRQDDYVIIRNYAEKTCHDQVDLLGKTYIINEELPRIKWKILNEIKEIAGFLCMKAETVDPVKGIKIHAWFSDEIQVFGGPEGYYGLPGMILAMEFNEDDVIIEATKVTFSEEHIELPIPKKMKGKKISRDELNEKTGKYITQSIEGRRNPYFQLRY
jgi:GLPGLI family protein